MPYENIFLRTCMEIARHRHDLLGRAHADNGFIRDDALQIKSLDKKRYSAEIVTIVELFHRLQHDDTFYTHCSGLARQAAAFAKRDSALSALRTQWEALNEAQRLDGLRILSRIFTNVLSDSDKGLCLNYPVLALAKFPAASCDTIAMQIQNPYPATDYGFSFYLLSINRDMLENMDFVNAGTLLWHEHQHMYMSGLRDMLRDDTMTPEHPLYKETYRSKTINDYKITGNISLAHEIYYAEPEEKLCYFTQDIFNRAFRYVPEHPAFKPIIE